MLRVLLLADTHLGFDLPRRPRVERRRRGHDFFANYQRTLDAAVHEQVDCVVHGGDVLYRSRVPPELVHRAFVPLKRVADAGIPVYLVPGNHERSAIPHDLLAEHPRVHLFRRPTTFTLECHGMRVTLAGFPYCRDDVRRRFPALLEETGWRDHDADARLLCIHHCFEGATVGPADHVFRTAADVVRHRDVPAEFDAVLAGHIHRFQVLTVDLRGRPLATPVLYPGSIERTSFAEQGEPKGYLMLQLDPKTPGDVVSWEFRPLPARPMLIAEIRVDGLDRPALASALTTAIASAPADAVLRLRFHGQVRDTASDLLRAANVRAMTPSTMNLEVQIAEDRTR